MICLQNEVVNQIMTYFFVSLTYFQEGNVWSPNYHTSTSFEHLHCTMYSRKLDIKLHFIISDCSKYRPSPTEIPY